MSLLRAIVILFILTSCGEKIEKEKLIGRYVWNDNRLDTLEVREDGSYEYWTHLPGRKLKNYGMWKFNSILNEMEFEKENFPFLKDHVENGSWYSKIRVKDNEIHFMYDPDRTQYLRQIKVSQ